MELSGHSAGIKHACYFRDDGCILSCSDDKTLRVWDLASAQVTELSASFREWRAIARSVTVVLCPQEMLMVAVSLPNRQLDQSFSLLNSFVFEIESFLVVFFL